MPSRSGHKHGRAGVRTSAADFLSWDAGDRNSPIVVGITVLCVPQLVLISQAKPKHQRHRMHPGGPRLRTWPGCWGTFRFHSIVEHGVATHVMWNGKTMDCPIPPSQSNRFSNPFWITCRVSSARLRVGSSWRVNQRTSAASLAARSSPPIRRQRKSINT